MPAVSHENGDAPQVNEAVDFLGEFAPNALQELRLKHPDLAAKYLTPGNVVLGGPKNVAELALRADVAVVTLKEVGNLCSDLLPRVKRRLVLNKNLRFAGQLLTTIGSSSILISLLVTTTSNEKVVAALFTLLSSVCTLVADRVASTLHGDLVGHYEALVDIQINGANYLREIQSWVASGFVGNMGQKAIGEAVSLSLKAKKLASEIT